MKKKYFGDKIEEDDKIKVKRTTLYKCEYNAEERTIVDGVVLETTDEEVDDDYIVEDSVYLRRVYTINSKGDILLSTDTEISKGTLDQEIVTNPENTIYIRKGYSLVEITNSDKLSGDILEFYSPEDKFSARNLNRPIFENFEDVENIYELMQNVCKTLYGQKNNGILPDVFEEMNSDNLQIGRYLNKTKRYIRIPTGAFFAKLTDKQAEYYKYTKTEDNQYSRDFYIDNDHNAAVIFNRPNVELFERQLAEHFNINLNDQDNNIKLNYYFDEDVVNELNFNSERAESVIMKNNTDKYNRKRRIKYYIEVSKTNYNYQKTDSGRTVITSVPIIERLPKLKSQDPTSCFNLITLFGNTYKNYLSKIDDYFSLEEVIEIPVSLEDKNNNYIIFFDPNTLETKTNENIIYSFSKKYGICSETLFNSVFGVDDSTVIRLYKLYIKIPDINKQGSSWYVNNTEGYPEVRVLNNYLEKIDRTTFDIKNINVSNFLNDLAIENKNNNVNLSEAHIAPNDEEVNNISIGFNNLGYSTDVNYSQKSNNTNSSGVALFGDDVKATNEGNYTDDRNRELASEGDKFILGINNIAIGTYSLMNTVKEENKYPKNNIGIGFSTLKNVYNGSDNIEIGYGNGNIKNTNHLINIGNNFKNPTSNAVDYNIVIGYENADNFTLNKRNIIFGFSNAYNTNSNKISINENNIIIGSENTLNKLDTDNVIIGNHNSYKDGGETYNDTVFVGNLNYIFGNDNRLKYLENENIIIGNSNQKNITSNSNYNIILGKNNNSKLKNIILGKNNFAIDQNNTVIGKNNIIVKEDESTVNFDVEEINNEIFGSSNNLNTSEGNFVSGSSNSLSDSGSDFVNGSSNSLNTSESNFINGSSNSLSDSESNFVNGSSNTLDTVKKSNIFGNKNNIKKQEGIFVVGDSNTFEDKLNNTTIIGSSLTNDECYVQDYSGFNYIDPLQPFNYNGDRPVNDTKPTFIFGKYKKEGSESGYFIKLDENGSSFIRANDLTVASDALYSEGPITTPIVNVRDYLFQNPGINKNKPTNIMYNALVPNAGTVTEADYEDLDKKYKTFIGTVNDDSDNIKKYVISIKEKNGYGTDNTFKLIYDCSTKRLSFIKTGLDEKTIIDTEGGQTINGDLTIRDYLNVKKYLIVGDYLNVANSIRVGSDTDTDNRITLNPDSESTFTNDIKANSFIANSIRVGSDTDVNNRITLNPDSESTFTNNIKANSFIANSARSLKTDIEPTKYNAIDEINKIEVVDFYFKSDDKKENPKVGFIADDTDPIFSTKEKNSMDLYNTCGMLLKAVQELSAENKELRERIEKLEK